MATDRSDSPVTDYTSLDYEPVLADLTRFAQGSAGINMTDLNPSDPAVMLLRALSYSADLLSYSADQRLRENIPTQAIRKENFSAGAKGLGVALRRTGNSIGELTFVVNLDNAVPVGGPLTIDETFKVSTDDGIIAQPTTSAIVGPGTGIVNVTLAAEEGDGTVDEPIGTSTGLAGQQFVLGQKPLIESTLVVSVAGVPWTVTSVLALALSTDKVFALRYTKDGSVFVVFGDGINGMVPSVASAVTATYKIGGGERGNVEADRFNRLVSSIPGVESVSNTAAFSGGTDEQTLLNAQANMPGTIRANDRCVDLADYAAVTLNVSGVLKAAADPGASNGGGCGAPVVVYVIPDGGGTITVPLRAEIQSYLRNKKMAGTRILVSEANYVDMAVSIDIHVLAGVSARSVKTLVSNTVVDRYDLATVNFGEPLQLQEVYDLLTSSNITGLSRIFVERFTVLGHVGYYRSAPSGNGVTLVTTDTVNARREWKVTVTSPGSLSIAGAFSVVQRYVGTAGDLSNITMEDQNADFPAANGLVGGAWYLRLNPYESTSTAKLIVGNTEGSVTVDAPDIRTYGDTGDAYVVEHTEANVGKIYRETLVGPLAGGLATLALVGAGWAVSDRLYMVDSAGVTHETQITGGISGAYTISPAIPAGGLAAGNITVHALWRSDDGLLRIVVPQGSTLWSTGDTLYVDTYESTGDAIIRSTDFPRLTAANLVLRTIGGRA